MSYNNSLREQRAGTHRQDRLGAAGPPQAPAPLSQRASGLKRQMAGILAVCVLVLGTRLKQLGRRSQPRHVPVTPLSSLGSPHH